MTIIVDTREKANQHILSVFDKFEVPYVKEKLDFGDYSCYYTCKEGVEHNLREIISVERKSGLDELSGNFTKGRKRFENEFKRHKGKMILAIEGCEYNDILENNYRSKMTPNSFLSSLHSWATKYDVPFVFVSKKEYMATFIYMTMKHQVREFEKQLKEEGK